MSHGRHPDFRAAPTDTLDGTADASSVVPPAAALGRVLAESVISPYPVPARSIALADGYAVKH
ncbi:MAG TPA: hypothetical protein PLQ11_04180 [Beijerinckiaceae bacterium]|nr:hypothetical protein [Beijerinckiaceae bacterium]